MTITTDHNHLVAIAYRMLGSLHDAEDAAQEAQIRWQRLGVDGRAEIRNPAAWLTTVVSRICLDMLGSARVRREQYVGVWLPEPLVSYQTELATSDPAELAATAESVSMAMLVLMEQLTPAERVAFVLHDLFAVPFAQISTIVGRRPEAVRQLASSARRHLQGARRYTCQGPDRDRVVQAFMVAATSGDLTALVAVLDPQVVLRSDGGGIVSSAIWPVSGADQVARFVLGVLTKPLSPSWAAQYPSAQTKVAPVLVNGETGLAVWLGEQLAGIVALTITNNQVTALNLVLSPQKLPPAASARLDT